MHIGGKHFTSIWVDPGNREKIFVIDQTGLPFNFRTLTLESVEDAYNAIREMVVRGAPLIGCTAAFGIYLATLELTPLANPAEHLHNAARYLASSRPTAINLQWALDRMTGRLSGINSRNELIDAAFDEAMKIWNEEQDNCRKIGEAGIEIIKEISRKKGGAPVNILTHCNAGWLACIDFGTATSPIYLAHDSGIPVHVWVDETRPRNQGARLTAYELGEHGVPYTLITDNAGGYLMRAGMVDMVITGSDRTARNGDVVNKIGTYLKALAAADNDIPFYVALPKSSIDINIACGDDIVIEERGASEVTTVEGISGGEITSVRICPEKAQVSNFGFDITPAKLITGLITEGGITRANEEEIVTLFNEKNSI